MGAGDRRPPVALVLYQSDHELGRATFLCRSRLTRGTQAAAAATDARLQSPQRGPRPGLVLFLPQAGNNASAAFPGAHGGR